MAVNGGHGIGERALGKGLVVASSAFLVVLALMTVLSVLGAPSGDTVIAQLADLRANDTLYRWGFFFASLVPATMVPLMAVVALGVAVRAEGDGLTVARLCGWAGALLVAAYAPLSAAAYASQYTVFEWLLRRDPAAAAPWFFLNEHGAVITFELLAYAIWGAGALLVAWPLLAHGGALRWLSWSLALSGALSVVAFGLFALGVGAAGTLSVVSGALTAVFGAAALVHGVRLAKRGS